MIVSPVNGSLKNLEEIKDPVFSTGIMGEGVVVIPDEGKIYAPISGKVIVLPATKHAIGIRGHNGMEVLIHVGLESDQIEGEFSSKIREGQMVKQGELLLIFDKKALEKKGYSLDTPIVITNSKDYHDIIKSKDDRISIGDNLMVVI